MKTLVELKVQDWKDREDVVKALANSGYYVAVEERKHKWPSMTADFYVIVKVPDKRKKEVL